MAQALLDAVADAATWKEHLARLPTNLRDVYFLSEYAALHCFTPDSRALMFAFQAEGEVWLYPFILRPVPRIGDYLPPETWFDIESPYGYGGPLASTDAADFCGAAHRAFAAWCEEQRIVAEFIRLHPLIENQRWLDPQVEVVYDRPTVSLNLAAFDGLKPDELPFASTSRNMVRRAQRDGVYVEAAPISDSFDEFVKMYRGTMRARGAAEYYYFSDRYFAELKRLAENVGFLLFAKQNNECVGAALFLNGAEYIHYHLSADGVRRVPGTTNVLLYEAARRAHSAGKSRLHLGGGVTGESNDSLLKFKTSMSSDTHSFLVGRRVHNRAAYDALRREWEQAHPSLVRDYGHRLLCYRIGSTTNE